jgi:hypothetical protein
MTTKLTIINHELHNSREDPNKPRNISNKLSLGHHLGLMIYLAERLTGLGFRYERVQLFKACGCNCVCWDCLERI